MMWSRVVCKLDTVLNSRNMVRGTDSGPMSRIRVGFRADTGLSMWNIVCKTDIGLKHKIKSR